MGNSFDGPVPMYKDIRTGYIYRLTKDNTLLDAFGDVHDQFEIIKESLQSQYKQAFDLLMEGENIVGTLDTDFGRQFVKDVENLYKLKSDKLKLSVAKEMLRDIQGYLVDEQYDDYNAKIDKFMNNSKNESMNEENNCGWEKFGKNREILKDTAYLGNSFEDDKLAEFLEKLKDGDVIDIFWKDLE